MGFSNCYIITENGLFVQTRPSILLKSLEAEKLIKMLSKQGTFNYEWLQGPFCRCEGGRVRGILLQSFNQDVDDNAFWDHLPSSWLFLQGTLLLTSLVALLLEMIGKSKSAI